MVYVNHDPLRAGDVGIFCVDGDMLCKQYYRDPLGVVSVSYTHLDVYKRQVQPHGAGRPHGSLLAGGVPRQRHRRGA